MDSSSPGKGEVIPPDINVTKRLVDKENLIKRAAELLKNTGHVTLKDWYHRRDQWLRDAGYE